MTASSDLRSIRSSRTALVARNAFSVLTSDVVNRATTFALYALVARHLGTHAFGQMSLALTFFYLSQVLAAAGLRTLLTREVAKRPDRVRDYLRAGTSIVAVTSCLSLAGLSLLVLALDYSPDTAVIILGVALGLFPWSLSQVFEGIFQALERMNYIAYSTVPVNALKITAALALLSSGRGLVALVALLVGAHCAVAAVEWGLMVRRVERPPSQREAGFAMRLARLTRPFLGIEGLAAVMSGASIILLSQLASEREVGLYNAAAQLMVPIGLVITSSVLSVYPEMCAKWEADHPAFLRTTQALFWTLLALVIPAAIGLFYLADDVLLLLYGEASFLAAAPVLRVLIPTVVLLSMTMVLGQVLYAAGRERTNLRITVFDAVASVVVGVVLIARFGLIGAAMTALAVRLADFVFHYVAVSKLMPSLTRLLWRPVLTVTRTPPSRRWHILAALTGIAVVIGLLTPAIAQMKAPPGTDTAPPREDGAIWTAGMEDGSLADWDEGGGGGEFNSGEADAVATQEIARDGDWSAELSITAPPESGARLFRWAEPRRHRDLRYEAWFYIPEQYELTGSRETGRFWNIVQFKSVSEDGARNDPFWILNVSNGPDGRMVPELVWWPETVEGPSAGETGFREYHNDDVELPVGRWFQITARVRQSKDFDGIVQFWLDGEEIFDLRDVRTGYANCAFNDWCVEQHWSVNLYSDGLSPQPAVIHVDDARITEVDE